MFTAGGASGRRASQRSKAIGGGVGVLQSKVNEEKHKFMKKKGSRGFFFEGSAGGVPHTAGTFIMRVEIAHGRTRAGYGVIRCMKPPCKQCPNRSFLLVARSGSPGVRSLLCCLARVLLLWRKENSFKLTCRYVYMCSCKFKRKPSFVYLIHDLNGASLIFVSMSYTIYSSNAHKKL